MSKPVLMINVTLRRLKALKAELQASKRLIVLNEEAVTHGYLDEEAVKALVAQVSPETQVKFLTHEDHPEIFFQASGALPGEIDKLEAQLVSDGLSRFLARRFCEQGVVTAFKQLLVERLHTTYYLTCMAKKIGGDVWVAPAMSDPLLPAAWFEGLSIPPGIARLNRHRWLERTALLWARLGHIMLFRLNRLRLRAKPVETDYAFQVAWGGVGDMGPDVPRHLNRFNDSFALDGKDIRFDNSLFVLGAWERYLSVAEKARLLDNIAQSDGHVLREADLGPTLGHLARRLGYFLAALPSLIVVTLRGGKGSLVLEQGLRLLRHLDFYDLFVLQAKPKVYMGLDDQGTQHVARTMVFEKLGLTNVGLGHSAFGGPQTVPSISFWHFHRYLTLSPAIPPLFAPFWEMEKVTVTGLPRGDMVHDSLPDEGQRKAFRDQVGGTYIILAMPCGLNPWNLMDRVEGFFETLGRLALEDENVRVVLKPRGGGGAANWHEDLAREIMEAALGHGRVQVFDDTFDTQELIAFSDVVIGAQASSAVGEALSIGRKTFCYNFNGLDQYNAYRQFDPRLAANGAEELAACLDYFRNDPASAKMIEKARTVIAPASGQSVAEQVRAALKTARFA